MGQQQRRRFVVHRKTSTSMQRPKVLNVWRAGWESWHESAGRMRNAPGGGECEKGGEPEGWGEARQAGVETPAW